MGWPKHNWGFIVMGAYRGPLCDNGNGHFVEASYAEVFLDRKVAEWVKRREQKWFLDHAWFQKTEARISYEEAAKRVKIIRIALPGTYAQFQIPGRLERNLEKERRL